MFMKRSLSSRRASLDAEVFDYRASIKRTEGRGGKRWWSSERVYLDLTAAHADLEARLRERGRAFEHAPVLEREQGSVPRTAESVALHASLRQRPAEMGAALRERVDPLAAADEHDRNAAGFDPAGRAWLELGLGEDRDEVRPFRARRVIDADTLSVDERASEIRRAGRHEPSQNRHAATGVASAGPAEGERGHVERQGGRVEHRVAEPDPAI